MKFVIVSVDVAGREIGCLLGLRVVPNDSTVMYCYL